MNRPYLWRWDCRGCGGWHMQGTFELSVEATSKDVIAHQTRLAEHAHAWFDGCAAPDLVPPTSRVYEPPEGPE